MLLDQREDVCQVMLALAETAGRFFGCSELQDNQIFDSRKAKSEFVSSLPINLAEAEDLLIQRALQETDGNIADAARLLGVHRTRIYRKLAQEESPAS